MGLKILFLLMSGIFCSLTNPSSIPGSGSGLSDGAIPTPKPKAGKRNHVQEGSPRGGLDSPGGYNTRSKGISRAISGGSEDLDGTLSPVVSPGKRSRTSSIGSGVSPSSVALGSPLVSHRKSSRQTSSQSTIPYV